MTSRTHPTEARRATRRKTAAPSTVRVDATGPIDAVVSDVSVTGARITCTADLRVAQEVTIGLASVGQVRGIVMWRRDDSYGLAFAQPLDEQTAARAFTAPTVVRLTGHQPGESIADAEGDDGDLYAEGTGWLSALLFTVVFGAVVAALVLRGMGWS